MENNESNMKPQQTGGLKLMTVFVVVLALHVVVIGGMTTYYLLKGGSADSELATDKAHKGLKANADGTLVSDGQMPDATDKSATAATPAPDANTGTPAATPNSTPTSAPDQTVSSDTSTAPSTPVAETPASVVTTPEPVTTPSTPAPTTPAVVTTSSLNPGAEPTAPVQSGPVITPPASLAPPPDAPQSAPATAGTTYVVKKHDSFAKIAHKNHVTTAELMAANSLTSNKLSIGQKLIIPAKAPVAATTPATVSTIAPATTDVATITPTTTTSTEPAPAPLKEKKAKSVTAVKSSTTLTKGTLDHHLYTVVKGDTLTKIAHKFKTTPAALMTANNITDPTKLSIGKKLMIPSKETHTAKVNEPATSEPAQAKAKPTAAQLANNLQ